MEIQFKIMSETPEQSYISKVHLKGYKSIRDLEIDFKPGLNIIIGPNGSGKTNFLEFVEEFLSYSNENLIKNNFSGEIQIESSGMPFNDSLIMQGSLSIKKTGKFFIGNNKKPLFKIQELIFNYDRLVADKILTYNDFNHEPNIEKVSGSYAINLPNKIEYGNPLKEILRRPLVIKVSHDFEPFNIDENLLDYKVSYLNLENRKQLPGVGLLIEDSFKSRFITDKPPLLKNRFILNNEFIRCLSVYTPIKNLKLNFDLAHEYDEGNAIDNLFLEFFVDHKWLKWSHLSDGTQRLFYIMTIYYGNKFNPVLIEEPELGIHPDQLHKLMDFLIEQSKEKQIIITTHSPEVLNAIHPDELDRIIVTRYDAEKGTVMKKLSTEQAKEMGERIKEGDMFLSDRWVHLNLEDEIFNAAQLNEK